MVVAMQYVCESDRDEVGGELAKNGTLKWKTPESLDPTIYDSFHPVWSSYVRVFEARRSLMSPGLYVGLFHLESTFRGMNILVPADRQSMIPVEKIRDDPTITPDELNWISSFTFRVAGEEPHEVSQKSGISAPSTSDAFRRCFTKSFTQIQAATGLTLDPKDLYFDGVVHITIGDNSSTFAVFQNDDELSMVDCLRFGGPILTPLHRKLNSADPTFFKPPGPAFPEMKLPPAPKHAPRGVARIVIFVRPMRTASTPRPATFNSVRYKMCPFALFECICHHTYNSAVYDPFRRTMLSLQETIYLLRSEMRLSLAKNGYPNVTDRTLDENYRHAQQIGALPGAARRTKIAVSMLEEEVANLNSTWLGMNWIMKLVQWDRKRQTLSSTASTGLPKRAKASTFASTGLP